MKIKTILVIGLGRIGLPQALLLAKTGFTVYGFDRNDLNKNYFSKGKTPFYEPEMDDTLSNTLNKTFFPITSIEELGKHIKKIDTVFFTIGTKIVKASDIKRHKSLDLSKYYALLDDFFSHKNHFKKTLHLVIRTTMPLGGTDRLKNYIEKKHNLIEGKDFFMAFVPERITEGSAFSEFKALPIIIGCYHDKTFKNISELFSHFSNNIIRVKNPKTAEFCKLTDNSYRNTLFSYANEIAMFANAENINAYEVIASVNDHYERNHIPQPGFVSGYCLSKDPYIFEMDFLKKTRDRKFHSLWYYGRKINDYLIDYATEKVLNHLKKKKKACVAIIGLSFNQAIDDFRVSHAITIMELLVKAGVRHFRIYDPNLNSGKYTQIPDHLTPYVDFYANKLTASIFENVNAIMICTHHKMTDTINDKKKLTVLLKNTDKPCYLFDGWNTWTSAKTISHVVYESIGYHHDE